MGIGRRDVAKERRWREVISRYVGSKCSVREFCRQESLAESAFHSWRRTIAQRDGQLAPRRRRIQARDGEMTGPVRQAAVSSAARSKSEFVPAIVAPAAHCDNATIGAGAQACVATITIELLGGRVFRWPASIDVGRIAELVHALETRGGR